MRILHRVRRQLTVMLFSAISSIAVPVAASTAAAVVVVADGRTRLVVTHWRVGAALAPVAVDAGPRSTSAAGTCTSSSSDDSVTPVSSVALPITLSRRCPADALRTSAGVARIISGTRAAGNSSRFRSGVEFLSAVAPRVSPASSVAFEDAASAVASSDCGLGDLDRVELFAASGSGS